MLYQGMSSNFHKGVNLTMQVDQIVATGKLRD